MGREILVLRIVADPTSLPTAQQLAQGRTEMVVSTAVTVAEARTIVESRPVDCVVCDLVVGSVSGLDLLAEFRQRDPLLPFVLVLGGGSEITVEDALAAGVTDCIHTESISRPSESDTEIALVVNRIRNAVGAARAVRDGLDGRQLEASQNDDAELRASEAKYRSLVEDILNSSHIGTFVLDPAFSVVWINDGIERYFGVDRADVIGRDKRELLTERICHIFEDAEGFAERVAATYDDNSYVEEFECHVLPADDRQERWLEHWSYPIEAGPFEGGRIEHYVDITARKRREAELATERQLLDRLFETSPVGIILLDAEGRITRANTHAETVLGLSESAITDRRYDDPAWDIHDVDGEPIPSDKLPFAQAARTAQPVFGFEHGIQLSNGSKRWLSISAAPLIAADESVDRVICAIRDMTEIRESERILKRQNDRLGEFASIVSHDLRNPLNVLAGSLELAEETGDPVHFERGRRAVDRMTILIDDLLSLARHGEGIDRTEAVDLGELAGECWTNLPTGEATLRIDTDAIITADRSRLEQLLENLFRNAVDHGGPTVTITVGALADGFVVNDDGPGIPPDMREQIFERGFSTQREGTGLGLSIVAQIADAHGWDITLADTDTGTRIELTGVDHQGRE